MAENDTPSKAETKKYRITKENAADFCKSAAAAKKARAEMRRKMLKVVVDEGLEKYLAKAIKSGDTELLGIVEKASKLTGIDFASSEDAVQRIQADANVNAKADTTLNLTFTEAK